MVFTRDMAYGRVFMVHFVLKEMGVQKNGVLFWGPYMRDPIIRRPY